MSLVIKKTVMTYDVSRIKRGYLLYGKHYTWSDGKSGFVTSVTENQLIVQYQPDIGNVTNHFVIPVSEVTDGEWEISWSSDLKEVWTYNISEVGKEEDRKDESGGIDL